MHALVEALLYKTSVLGLILALQLNNLLQLQVNLSNLIQLKIAKETTANWVTTNQLGTDFSPSSEPDHNLEWHQGWKSRNIETFLQSLNNRY